MVERRGILNKKAQGLPITTIILVILGLIVLVVLVLILIRGTSILYLIFGIGESSQVMADKCTLAVSQNAEGIFCQFTSEETRLDGVKQYYNCNHVNICTIFQDEVDTSKIPNCAAEGFPGEKKFCVDNKLTAKTIVNGKACGDGWGVQYTDGTVVEGQPTEEVGPPSPTWTCA